MRDYSDNKIVVPRFNEENGFYTSKERSKLMGKIKGLDTKPELKLRKALWKLGYRYRKNVRNLPGTPDIVIKKVKLIIFVDGGFWHGFNWEEKKYKIKTNRDFWIPKIERNMQRDKSVTQKFEGEGWQVILLWEHEIKNDFENCISQITNYIENFPLA